jgi:hypothetical protein
LQGTFPNITGKNASGPGASDGTPFTKDYIDDLWGWMQDLLNEAGLVPNGQPEEAGSSQIVQSLRILWEDKYNRLVSVGKMIMQLPDEPSPVAAGLPGVWQVWSHRAVLYGLSDSIPSYAAYAQGASFAANAYALFHLSGSDWKLYRAKAAISNAPQYLDPVKWNSVAPGIRIARNLLQPLTDNDFSIGHQISSGPYAGRYVTEIIVPGGKFTSVEGGFRPTFESGGT